MAQPEQEFSTRSLYRSPERDQMPKPEEAMELDGGIWVGTPEKMPEARSQDSRSNYSIPADSPLKTNSNPSEQEWDDAQASERTAHDEPTRLEAGQTRDPDRSAATQEQAGNAQTRSAQQKDAGDSGRSSESSVGTGTPGEISS